MKKPKSKKTKLNIGTKCHGENVKVYRRDRGFAVSFKDPEATIVIPVHTAEHAIHKVKIIAEKPSYFGFAEIRMFLVEGGRVIARSEKAQVKYDRSSVHSVPKEYLLTIETRKIKESAISAQRVLKIRGTEKSKALFYINRLQYKVIQKKKTPKNTDSALRFHVFKETNSVSDFNKEVLMTDTSDFPAVSIIVYGEDKYLKKVSAVVKDISVYPNCEVIVGHEEEIQGTPEPNHIESTKQGDLIDVCSGEYVFFLKDDFEINPFILFNLISSMKRYRLIYRRGDTICQYLFARRKDFYRYDEIKLRECSEERDVKFDLSFVSCVNNIRQYTQYIIASLYKNHTDKVYELVPILNFKNKYSAAQALNIGTKQARSNLIIACHQDLIFYRDWVETLFVRIGEIEEEDENWGVLGTAGITTRESAIGRVYDLKGRCQWEGVKSIMFASVQTVDEHCVIYRKDSGLEFDEERFDSFHFYSIDLSLLALSRGFKNYGIMCPLSHISNSASMLTGEEVFMKYLTVIRKKWEGQFRRIKMPTAIIERGKISVFIKFKKEEWNGK